MSEALVTVDLSIIVQNSSEASFFCDFKKEIEKERYIDL